MAAMQAPLVSAWPVSTCHFALSCARLVLDCCPCALSHMAGPRLSLHSEWHEQERTAAWHDLKLRHSRYEPPHERNTSTQRRVHAQQPCSGIRRTALHALPHPVPESNTPVEPNCMRRRPRTAAGRKGNSPMIVGSSSRCALLAGMIARPLATSERTNSTSTPSRAAQKAISSVMMPSRA
jgi:hypothetical protein